METIYKVWCPKCKKHMYVNNGNTDDLSVSDVEGTECPYCKHRFRLGDSCDADDDDGYEPYFKPASKALN